VGRTKQDIRLRFASSIEELKDVNESFSTAVMRICYTGVNRNNSRISKEAVERALPTMFNCPVVCNYDVESDSIGGHDVDLVHTSDGRIRLINLTSAVGVVPAGARTWWERVEDSGTSHEYFTTEVILWKRSPAYQKIAGGGITAQSMEITVRDGRFSDGVFAIDDFIFTAFCLLGEDVEPCFESASLQMFGKESVEQQFTRMMQELKKTFSAVQPAGESAPQKYSLKGGREALDDTNKAASAVSAAQEEPVGRGPADGQKNFDLEGQLRDELVCALEREQVETPWGQDSRYWFWDYDKEASEVYANDTTDWNIYAFPYSMDGDHVVIDFSGKKRMKLALAPFDEGSQASPAAGMFSKLAEKYDANEKRWNEKYQKAAETAASVAGELASLRKFKADTEAQLAQEQREAVFSKFEDLNGSEAFEALRRDSNAYSPDALEEKCYAIRGRTTTLKFTRDTALGPPKLLIDHNGNGEDEPYGGLFVEHGVKAARD